MNDPLFKALSTLSTLDLSPQRAEALRVEAQAELQRQAAQSLAVRRFSCAYNWVLEPVLMTAVVVAYAGWGLSVIDMLFTARG